MVTMETKPAMSDCTESRLQGAVGWEGGRVGGGGGEQPSYGAFYSINQENAICSP